MTIPENLRVNLRVVNTAVPCWDPVFSWNTYFRFAADPAVRNIALESETLQKRNLQRIQALWKVTVPLEFTLKLGKIRLNRILCISGTFRCAIR